MKAILIRDWEIMPGRIKKAGTEIQVTKDLFFQLMEQGYFGGVEFSVKSKSTAEKRTKSNKSIHKSKNH